MFIRRNILPVISKLNSIISWSTTNTHSIYLCVRTWLEPMRVTRKKNSFPCKAFLIWGWVCQKNELWFVAIFGSHSRGGAFESWTLWARRPTLWGIHLAICESQQSPPLLTNLSSRHISQAYTTAVCLSISQFKVLLSFLRKLSLSIDLSWNAQHFPIIFSCLELIE